MPLEDPAARSTSGGHEVLLVEMRLPEGLSEAPGEVLHVI
jgi:hypothetical protein